MGSNVAHALALAARGFRIIPLHDPGPNGKRPRLNDWVKQATTDPATIVRWFTAWPEANIGAAMGGPERLVVIDVDGFDGTASWHKLIQDANWNEGSLQSNSGSGNGCHLFFRVQPHQDLSKIRNAIKFRPGLDIRAEGGQVVLPPSLHASGNIYYWGNTDTPIAPLPDWLYDLIKVDDHPQSEQVDDRVHRTDPPLMTRIERARAYLQSLPAAISGQQGHNTLIVATSAAYRGFDLPRAAALLILEEYNRRCEPAWSRRELDHKLDAVEGAGDPWGWILDAEDMAQSIANAAAPAPEPPVIASALSARIRKLGGRGPRIATGIPTLDRVTRGGLGRSSVVVIGGAPGACKTTLAVHQAVRFAQAGAPVAILAADEDADGLLIRVGQVLGLDRDAVEGGQVLAEFEQRVAGLPLSLFGADEPGATVEGVALELAKSGPGVLVIDSLQTARTATSARASDARTRLDDVVRTVKACATKYGHAVVVTSELSRASYRSKDAASQIDDLAAFKESGSIEYAGTVLLVLRNPRDSGGIVDVSMPKNRLGFERADFRLQLDPDRATLAEVEGTDDGTATARRTERFQGSCLQAWELVRDVPAIKSKRTFLAKCRERGVRGDNALLTDALDRLVELELVAHDKEGFRALPWRDDAARLL